MGVMEGILLLAGEAASGTAGAVGEASAYVGDKAIKAGETAGAIADKAIVEPAQQYIDTNIVAKDEAGNTDGWGTAENVGKESIKFLASRAMGGNKPTSGEDETGSFVNKAKKDIKRGVLEALGVI